jgi:hypothetical protein
LVLRHGKLLIVLAVWLAGAPSRAESIALVEDKPLPFTLIDNRIFVPVTINGLGPYQFVFDTGGSNIVDPEVARTLGLSLKEDGEAWGAGAGRQQAWTTQVDIARVGGVEMKATAFRAVSLEAIRRAIGFRRLDGIVGQELFERFVIDIDYERSQLSFHDPKSFAAAKELGPPLRLSFLGGIPMLDAEVDGLRGPFVLDTGDRSSLTLFVPFVERHGLRQRYSNQVHAVTGWGVGGPIPADVTRVGKLTLAGYTLPGIVTRMPVLKSGAFAMSDAAGSIGTGVFKRFRTVFDYSRKQMFLKPNGAFGDADPHDRSGLWLSLADGGFKVMSVVAGSPAQDAGIKVDDVVTAVDGAPASSIFLVDLRHRLKTDKPGTVVRLGLKDGRVAALVLRDLI